MVDLRRIAVAALTVVALGGSAAGVATGWSPFALDNPVLSTSVTPEAVTRNLSCTGSVVAAVADSTTWTQLGAVDISVEGGSTTGSFSTDTEPTGAIVGHDGDAQAVVASESIELFTDVMTGLIAAECSDASNSAWLIGGSTVTGRDGILTISNPTSVDARVDLEFFGLNGFIDAPAARGIIIAAGTQRSYSVAGFAPNEPSPAIHVVSNGAPVWSTLQISTVRGLVPGGLDRLTPVSVPATTLSIPIIREPEADVIAPLRSEPDYGDTESMMRFFASGASDADITMTITPHASDSVPVVVTTSVESQHVVDIPLAELHDGDYTISIESTEPLFAVARVSSHNVETSVTDVAWVSALPASAERATARLPFDGTLSIVNPNDTEISVVVSANGSDTTVIIGAKATTSVFLRTGTVALTSDSPFVSSVFIETPNGIAVLRPRPAPLGSQAVTVIAH